MPARFFAGGSLTASLPGNIRRTELTKLATWRIHGHGASPCKLGSNPSGQTPLPGHAQGGAALPCWGSSTARPRGTPGPDPITPFPHRALGGRVGRENGVRHGCTEASQPCTRAPGKCSALLRRVRTHALMSMPCAAALIPALPPRTARRWRAKSEAGAGAHAGSDKRGGMTGRHAFRKEKTGILSPRDMKTCGLPLPFTNPHLVQTRRSDLFLFFLTEDHVLKRPLGRNGRRTSLFPPPPRPPERGARPRRGKRAPRPEYACVGCAV